MAILKRRTSELLSLVLVSCLLIGLVGAILVAIRDPYGSLWGACAGCHST